MATMSLQARMEKTVTFFLAFLYYMGGYSLINYWTQYRSFFYSAALPGEEQVPFSPLFMAGYLLIFFNVGVMYLAIDDVRFMKKMGLALCACMTVNFAIFLLWPVRYDFRPHLLDPASPLLQFIQYYYFIDLPYNCFPSSHVSTSFLAAYCLSRYDRRWMYILFPSAIIIAISTVLVKQHYILDAVAGFLLASLTYWLFYYYPPVARWADLVSSKHLIAK